MSDATTTSTPPDVSSATADSTAVPASTAPANLNATTEGTLLSSAPTSTTTAQAEPAEPVEKPEWLPEKFWREDKADVEALSKSYQGLEQLLGKKANSVPVPNDKSTPEEVSAPEGHRRAGLTGGLQAQAGATARGSKLGRQRGQAGRGTGPQAQHPPLPR